MKSRLTIGLQPTHIAVTYMYKLLTCAGNFDVEPSKFIGLLEIKKTVIKNVYCCYVLHPIICSCYAAQYRLRFTLRRNVLRQNGRAKTAAPNCHVPL